MDAASGGIKTGVSWTVRRCIDGTFAAAGGTATEDGTTGWYKFAMTQADTNGNNIGFNFTGTGAVPQTVNIVTTAADPTDAVRFGLTALPNANAEAAGGLYTRGTGAGQIAQDANGNVRVNLDTIKTQTVTCAGGVTVPAATLASTTNITAGTITTTTNLTTNNDKTGYRLDATGSAALTEGYATDGAAATLPQLLYLLLAVLTEASVSGTTLTAHKLDGTTSAATFTLDSATSPTSITRAS